MPSLSFRARLTVVSLVAIATVIAIAGMPRVWRAFVAPLTGAETPELSSKATVTTNGITVRPLVVDYTGDERAASALRSNLARPRAMASADLDGNGTPDLIVGYGHNGAGIVTVQRGNPDAYAPTDESVYPRIQQGYNPEPLLPSSDVYETPFAIQHLVVGNFDENSQKDVLFAADAGLYLLRGNGSGQLGSPEQLGISGAISVLAAGEFAAPDGSTDVALGVNGTNGPAVQMFDASNGDKFSQPSFEVLLSGPASAITFGALDDDPFVDVAIVAGNEITIIHGAGRQDPTPVAARVERISLDYSAAGVAIGHFVWDRKGREELAVLDEDGTVHILAREDLDTRPYSDADRPTRGTHLARLISKSVDVETIEGWQADKATSWQAKGQIATGATSPGLFKKVHISDSESDDLLIAGADQNLRVVHASDPAEKGKREGADQSGLTAVDFAVASPVVASVMLPRKINGEGGLVLMTKRSSDPLLVPLAPAATIDVDTTADNPALSACTAAAGDCSLRGAITHANSNADSTTINLPNGTYVLNINGSTNNGCDGNATGDLEINQTTIIVGGGQTTTVIRQTGLGSGGAGTGARVMCLNNLFLLNLTYQFSGLTITGGRSLASSFGGGGIIGGEKDNNHTFTNVTLSNNQATGGTFPGGGIQILGGNTTFTNSLVGGSSAPGADRTNVNLANSDGTSAGGVFFTPSAPQHTASVATFTSNGTTFSRNTASGLGGGGADMAILAIGAPGGIGSGSATFTNGTQFNNNQSLVNNGGGLIVSTLPTTVSGASFTSNSAAGQGGGIYVGSASLLLDGTVNAISFTGNTAVANGGSSISVNNATTVAGTLVSIGGDVVVNAQGTWTNNAGSILAPTNFLMFGGIFNGNNSTMNIAGNLSMAPQTVGTTFNANTSTINIGGNFSFTGGGAGPVATFNAGTGTINFNGTAAQSISNTVPITFFNLTDSNTNQPLTANNSFSVGGTLNVNGANAIFDPVAASVISGAGTLTGTGTARVRRIAATADFLSQYTITNKTLTNLTVEYIGSAAQTGSAITYGGLKINNASGVTLAAGTTTVNGTLTLTAGQLGVGANTLVINNGSSVGAGSLNGGTGTVNYNQGSNGQAVLAANYGILIFSNFSKVLPSSGSVGVAATFTPGSGAGHTITGSTFDFNGSGSQTIPSFNYNNLTSSSTGGRTLANSGTIGIAGSFTPGTNVYIIAGSTIDFNGSGSQTIPSFNFNNLTSSNAGARTILASITVGIAGTFTPGTNGYTLTGSTINFNGSALQTIPAFTFNGLTLSNAAGANLGSNVTIGGALTLTSGALGVGINTLTLNGSVSAGAGSLTSGITGTVIYNQSSNGQATVLAANYGNLTFSSFSKTLAASGTIGIAGTFIPGTGTGHTITGSTINFNGAGVQTIPGFTYNNLTSSGGVIGRTLDPVNTIRIAGVFTPGTNVYTITGSTIEYNGSAAQTLPAHFYNNLTLNNVTNISGFAGLTVHGLLRIQAGTFTSSSSSYNNVQIDPGATMVATAASTINITGNWTNNGTFTPSTGTLIFNGASPQSFNGNFNNLTVNNGSGVSLGGAATINGNLTLTSGTLNVGSNTMTLNSGVSGSSGILSNADGTVNYNQSPNGQSVIVANYGNLTFSNFNKVLPGTGTIGVAGTFTPGAAVGHTITGSTFDFNGSGAQTIPAFTYNNLTSSSTGARTLANSGTIGIAGVFTPSTNIYTITGSTIEYNGSALQTLPASFTSYHSLTVNNAAGVVLGGNTDVDGVFALTNGTINAGANTLTVGPGGSSTRTSGHVLGNLAKVFAATGPFTFHVGTATGYSPVATDITALTVNPSTLTIRANDGNVPPLNDLITLDRFWSLTESGDLTANLLFTYLQTDVDGNEGNYHTFRVTGGVATGLPNGAPCPGVGSPCVDPIAHTIKINGVSAFSEWTAGEFAPTAAGVSVSGRVMTPQGRGLASAVVTITDSNGITRMARTSTFGYYRFEDIMAGETYIMAVRAKRYVFDTRLVSVMDELTDVNFVAIMPSKVKEPRSGFLNVNAKSKQPH